MEGGIKVAGHATLYFESGIITENTASAAGGGIFAVRDSFVYVNGGTITGNTAVDGAGIGTATAGSVIMSGGIITGNEASSRGGGLLIGHADFTMTGGEITNNKAVSSGGGVWFGNDWKLQLAGGKITGNTAPTGAGVYLNSGTVHFAYLRGTVEIIGNTITGSENEDNIRFESREQYFELDGNLDSSSNVGFNVRGCHRFLNGGDYIFDQNSVKIDNLDATTQTVIKRFNNMFVEPKDPVTADEGYFSAKVNGEDIYYTTLQDAFYDLPVDDNTIYCEKEATISTSTSLQREAVVVLTAKKQVTLTISQKLIDMVSSNHPFKSVTIHGPIVFDGNNLGTGLIRVSYSSSSYSPLSTLPTEINIGCNGDSSGYPIIKNFKTTGNYDGIICHSSLSSGSINLYGCIIEENEVPSGSYNGVVVSQSGTINMYDGCIIKNNKGVAPIIYLNGATFNLRGGTIEGNTNSGYVISRSGAVTVNQYGGEIKNNDGTGVDARYEFIYNLYGGSITGNKGTGGGIYIYEGKLSIKGNPVIKDNTNGNVRVAKNFNKIILAGELKSGADIRVTSDSADNVIAEGDGTYDPTESDLQYFTSDENGKAFYYDSANKKIMKGNPSVKITLHPNNGISDTVTQYVVSNKETPLKNTGFSFENWNKNGWNTAADGTGTAYTDKVTTSSLLNLYAQWTAEVTLDENGGDKDGSVKVAYMNASLSDYTAATYAGHNLEGYYTDAECTSKVISVPDSGNPTLEKNVAAFTNDDGKWINSQGSAVILYANWTAKQYKVTFNANGGTPATTEKEETYDSNYVLPPNPTRTGYTFAGWWTAESGGTQVTTDTKVTITAEQTLYAHWTANKYTVSFDANGGSPTPNAIEETYDSNYKLPDANPTKAGYTFAGWWTAASGGEQVTTATKVEITDAQTLYAHWKVNQYTITFDSKGGSAVASITQDYDTAVATPANPTKKGYTFAAWNPTVPTKMPANDMTCVAQWTANQTTVTLNTDGGSSSKTTVTAIYEQNMPALTAAELPTKTGYTFTGYFDTNSKQYYNADGTSKAVWDKDVTKETLYANWTANTYTIHFDANGGTGTMADQSFTYDEGEKALSENKFTNDGHTFEGWAESKTGEKKYNDKASVSNLASTKDAVVNLYAVWKIIEVKKDPENGKVEIPEEESKTVPVAPQSPVVKSSGSRWCYSISHIQSNIR